MYINNALNQLLKLLLDIKNDMKQLHNIEYSTAYIKINKAIELIDGILKYKTKPIKKFGIFLKSNK